MTWLALPGRPYVVEEEVGRRVACALGSEPVQQEIRNRLKVERTRLQEQAGTP